MPDALRVIRSRDELHSLMRTLLDALSKDFPLALRACANPFFALEEMGYQIDPELRVYVERRMRFNTATAARLDELAKQIQHLAGRRFSLDTPEQLSTVLFEELKLNRPAVRTHKGAQLRPWQSAHPAAPLDPQPRWAAQTPDPLEELRDAHPIIPPLLEYRRIEAGAPRFAPREIYLRIKRGEMKLPITRLSARVKTA